MSERLYAKIVCGLLGLFIGVFAGWLVNIFNGLSGTEAILIIAGFGITCSILLAYFYRPIVWLIEIFFQVGQAGSGSDIGIDPDVSVPLPLAKPNTKGPTRQKKHSPWRHPYKVIKKD